MVPTHQLAAHQAAIFRQSLLDRFNRQTDHRGHSFNCLTVVEFSNQLIRNSSELFVRLKHEDKRQALYLSLIECEQPSDRLQTHGRMGMKRLLPRDVAEFFLPRTHAPLELRSNQTLILFHRNTLSRSRHADQSTDRVGNMVRPLVPVNASTCEGAVSAERAAGAHQSGTYEAMGGQPQDPQPHKVIGINWLGRSPARHCCRQGGAVCVRVYIGRIHERNHTGVTRTKRDRGKQSAAKYCSLKRGCSAAAPWLATSYIRFTGGFADRIGFGRVRHVCLEDLLPAINVFIKRNPIVRKGSDVTA